MFLEADKAILQSYGTVLFDTIPQIASATVLYGSFILLFALTTHSFCVTRSHSRSHVIHFAASIVGFLLSSLYWAIPVAYLASNVRATLMQGQELDRGRLNSINAANKAGTTVANWVIQIQASTHYTSFL